MGNARCVQWGGNRSVVRRASWGHVQISSRMCGHDWLPFTVHWKTADQLFYLDLQQTCLVRLAPALNMHVISISYETQLFPSFPFPRTLFLSDIRSNSMLSLFFYLRLVFFLCFPCRIFLIWFDFIGCSGSVFPEDASLSLIAVSSFNWQIYHFIGPFRGICTIFLLSQLHQW